MTGTMIVPATQRQITRGMVYCPICTRAVEADVVVGGRRVFVKGGQKCPRCASSLDSASVLEVPEAA